MTQGWLPGFDGTEADELPALEVAPAQGEECIRVPVLRGQIKLFTVEREMVGLIEAAILDGRFEEARQHREALTRRKGLTGETRQLGILDELATPAFWALPIGECVDRWLELNRDWEADARLRRLVGDGVLLRLLNAHGGPAVITVRPTLLAPIVNLLGKGTAAGDAAGELLRDALAAGIGAASGEFDTAEFVDLLAEDAGAPWLACVGALRRLWPVPALPPCEVDGPLPPAADDDAARGAQFWHCLRLATWCPRDSAPALEARKRMKQLAPNLHARFMKQGVRRE